MIVDAGDPQVSSLRVFDIQRFSYHDGPGIRTVVFLKGCNLRCFWCQNPESQSPEDEILFFAEKCVVCGKCAIACPWGCHAFPEDGTHVYRRDSCLHCGRCVTSCYADALQIAGRTMTLAEIMREIQKDVPFYELSGGGVTLSGGEPLLQAAGCTELLKACRRASIDTALETAGNVSWRTMAQVLPFVDELLLDIKTLDDDVSKAACEGSNARVLDNLRRVKSLRNLRLTIRVPIVPGINNRKEEVAAIAGLVSGYPNLKAVELVPFHRLGAGKYRALGRKYPAADYPEPDRERMRQLRAIVDSITGV